MYDLIIRNIRLKYGKGDLDTGVGKTNERMMRVFDFIEFIEKMLSSIGL